MASLRTAGIIFFGALLGMVHAAVPVQAPAGNAPPSATPAPLAVRTERVQYGMAGHDPLYIDILRPPQPRPGRLLVYVASGGFRSGPRVAELYQQVLRYIPPLTGFTLVTITHGNPPGTIVPEMIEQVEQGVRYLRAHAEELKLNTEHLTLMGASSGAHLALMVAMRGQEAKPDAPDALQRVGTSVDGVVAFFPPTDLLNYGQTGHIELGVGPLAWVRQAFTRDRPGDRGKEMAWAKALSPVYAISKHAPPVFLVHGDQDRLVPLQQSQRLLGALRKAGIPAELRVRHGYGHGWFDIQGDLSAAFAWLARQTRG